MMQMMTPAAGEPDPFASYVNGAERLEINELPPTEADLALASEVKVKRVLFRSLAVPVPGGGMQRNEVFAVVVRPAARGDESERRPGLLLLHGGKGAAEIERAIAWARRGYVVVAPGLPGIADPATAGPANGFWLERPYASDRWRFDRGPEGNAIFQAVVAAWQSLELLAAQPDVDALRLGVYGISWGGYTTTMVAALAGDRVKAAFSIFGSGFYEHAVFAEQLAQLKEADRERWLEWLDAGRRAHAIRAEYFIAAAANDHFFRPPAVMATLEEVAPARRNQLFAPNSDHRLDVPGGSVGHDAWPAMAAPFFDYLLKGEGDPLPRIEAVAVRRTEQGRLAVEAQVASPRKDLTAQLWISRREEDWRKRTWQLRPMAAVGPDGQFDAILPAGEITGEWDGYVLVYDDRTVTVSSLIIPLVGP